MLRSTQKLTVVRICPAVRLLSTFAIDRNLSTIRSYRLSPCLDTMLFVSKKFLADCKLPMIRCCRCLQYLSTDLFVSIKFLYIFQQVVHVDVRRVLRYNLISLGQLP